MKRPAMHRKSLSLLIKAACAGLCLASAMVFAAPPTQRQQEFSNKATVRSDRKNPRKAPEKIAPGKSPETRGAGGQTVTSITAPTDSTDAAEAPLDAPVTAAGALPQGCYYHTVLLRDTIRVIFVNLYNYPENSAIPVTMTQTNPGIMGFAMTDAGPYTPTVDLIVNTNSNGDGTSAPVFTQGQTLGYTITYGDTPYGATTTLDFNVLPQCNCPAIPVVP